MVKNAVHCSLLPVICAAVDSYTASVSLDTEKLTVSAVPASDKATVALSGTDLQDGENTVTCTVTAEIEALIGKAISMMDYSYVPYSH